jgi:hypothetical protein
MKRQALTHRIFLVLSPRYISVKGRLVWLPLVRLGPLAWLVA